MENGPTDSLTCNGTCNRPCRCGCPPHPMEAVLEKCIERISRSLDTVADSHVQIFLDERRAIREELAELRETNHLEFKKVLPFDPSKRRARP